MIGPSTLRNMAGDIALKIKLYSITSLPFNIPFIFLG
jgi:hypothetical protein